MANNKKHKNTPTNWDIERFNPYKTPWYSRKLLNEHLTRYNLASEYVKGKIVVEMGCGMGYGTYAMSQNGAKKVYGIDIDKSAIEFAIKNYNHSSITYLNESATKSSITANYADVVIAFEVIEHLQNPRELINEVLRILKPGGTFILSTPNRSTSLKDNPFHIKEFKFTELNSFLNDFKVKRYYGQGIAFTYLIHLYQKLIKHIKNSFLKRLLYLRPWEGYRIYPLSKKMYFKCIYFIAICEK